VSRVGLVFYLDVKQLPSTLHLQTDWMVERLAVGRVAAVEARQLCTAQSGCCKRRGAHIIGWEHQS